MADAGQMQSGAAGGSGASAEQQTVELGIIGMGDMGRMYARCLHAAGWAHVNVCDRPEQYEQLRTELAGACPRLRLASLTHRLGVARAT